MLSLGFVRLSLPIRVRARSRGQKQEIHLCPLFLSGRGGGSVLTERKKGKHPLSIKSYYNLFAIMSICDNANVTISFELLITNKLLLLLSPYHQTAPLNLFSNLPFVIKKQFVILIISKWYFPSNMWCPHLIGIYLCRALQNFTLPQLK